MNHATICVIKNQLRHPFSQYNKSMEDISTIFAIALSYINNSVVVSKKMKSKAKNKQKDAPSLCDKKCIDKKTEVRRVQTESV